MTTYLRTRLNSISLDPADASQSNYDFLCALVEAAELLREARENIPPHEWDCHTDGLVERIDTTLAKLEATK